MIITVHDHALTRPWTVDKKYVLEANPRPDWSEAYCSENPSMIAIGKDSYFLGGDGMLMPVRKGQLRRICAISSSPGNDGDDSQCLELGKRTFPLPAALFAPWGEG